MKTGITIGTHNNGRHIAATIASVRNQSETDWQCLIVDNGSTDDTVEVIRREIGGDDRFAWIAKENEGPSAFRNLGFSHFRGRCDYLFFFDGDDIIKETFLSVLTGYLDRYPEVGLVGCQYDLIDETGKGLGPGFRSRYVRGPLGFPRSLKAAEYQTPFESFFAATGQGHFAVFRERVFAETTGYEPDFWSHEDSDIFCQMALRAEVHYLPHRLYARRVHGHNLTYSPKADYSKFRHKWDLYRSEDPARNQQVIDAVIYYYGFHAPLRFLKVALKTARDYARRPQYQTLKWLAYCLRRGIVELLFKPELRQKLKAREAIALAGEGVAEAAATEAPPAVAGWFSRRPRSRWT